ncbi:MAG: xylose isomerase, partial [bacterium]
MLGSVDANRGDMLLGWDTDEFPTDLYGTTFAMLVILEQNGLAPGGLNFDAHVRRSSTDLEDLFIAHIGAMDAFAHGLKVASKIIKDGVLSGFIKNRYSSYDEGIGAKIEAGTTDFKELEAYVLANGNPKQISGKQEMLENVLNQYLLGH